MAFISIRPVPKSPADEPYVKSSVVNRFIFGAEI